VTTELVIAIAAVLLIALVAELVRSSRAIRRHQRAFRLAERERLNGPREADLYAEWDWL